MNVGPFPFSLAWGDLNQDSLVDLVFTNGSGPNSKLGVLHGNGNATFENRIAHAVADDPTSVVSVDLNDDQILDLAASGLSNVVSILIGKSDGAYEPEVRYAVGTSPRNLIADDLDGNVVIGQADVDQLVLHIIGTRSGDTNLDGMVDASDLNDLALNWRSREITGWATGDFPGDVQTDAADLNQLALSWQSGVSGAATTVVVIVVPPSSRQ